MFDKLFRSDTEWYRQKLKQIQNAKSVNIFYQRMWIRQSHEVMRVEIHRSKISRLVKKFISDDNFFQDHPVTLDEVYSKQSIERSERVPPSTPPTIYYVGCDPISEKPPVHVFVGNIGESPVPYTPHTGTSKYDYMMEEAQLTPRQFEQFKKDHPYLFKENGKK